MLLAINSLNQKYKLNTLNSMPKQTNTPKYHTKSTNFTSLEAAALEAQAMYGTRRSLISTAKTRLGANFNPHTNTIDFKLASDNAKDVILCIFDEPKGTDARLNVKMTKREGTNIFETSIPLNELGGGKKPVYYGYRIFGKNWEFSEDFFNNPQSGFKSLVDKEGNRFNPNKLAFDPYAKELSHLPSDNPMGEDAFIASVDNYLEDNAKYAPKSVFAPIDDTIIPKASPRP